MSEVITHIMKLLKNKDGIVNIIVGAVLAIVVAGILLMIGVEINASIYNAMPAVTGEANTTIGNVNNAIYGGYQLATVLPVVLAASAIIIAILAGFAYSRSRT